MGAAVKKKVLITGGGGYLGSRLAEKLWNPLDEFYLMDLNFNEMAGSLSEKHPNVFLVRADVSRAAEAGPHCGKIQPDLIFHFAALLDRSRDFSIFPALYRVNVEGTLNLLNALAGIPYAGFYFSSSSEVYGAANPVPFQEDQAPLALSPYSLTKLMAEELIRTFGAVYDKPYVILRLFNFYGPGMPESTFLPQLMGALKRNEVFRMSKGEQRRDYLATDDLVSCIAMLAENTGLRQEIVNICSGVSYSMKQIAEFVNARAGGQPALSPEWPYRGNELWDNRGSNEKLRSLVPGFEPGDFLEKLGAMI